jgi:hypothetical protein
VAGRNSTEEKSMTEIEPGGITTLAVRLSGDLRRQLTLIASLDGVSLAEAIRIAVEESISRRRSNGDLAKQAQAALAEVDREAAIRRAELQALLGTEPAADKPATDADEPPAAEPPAPATKPGGRPGGRAGNRA